MPLAALCQRCALCCDGTLFTTVPLAADEVASVRRRGLVVLADDAGAPSRLPQPCAALRDLRCTIYDERPDACRRYRCMLLAALEAGEVSLPEALDVVGEARARLAALAADLPGAGPALARARAAVRAGDLSQETQTLLGRATAFLDRRFRGHTRR